MCVDTTERKIFLYSPVLFVVAAMTLEVGSNDDDDDDDDEHDDDDDEELACRVDGTAMAVAWRLRRRDNRARLTRSCSTLNAKE